MSKITVVVGGQYGSEGKGAITGHIAAKPNQGLVGVTRVAGPNAGHTAYDAQGRKWALRQVPVGAVTNPNAHLFIGPGSEIDPTVLRTEVEALDKAGLAVSDRLFIDNQATILGPQHIERETAEGLTSRIGSTGKGIGAARADRVMRTAMLAREYGGLSGYGLLRDTAQTSMMVDHLIIEGTQGYGLGLHTDAYPQVTSSDCRAIDFLAMAGVNPWDAFYHEFEVVVVARAYPIRVAGNSGPLNEETTWEQLGLEAERTTVTQKIRRVGRWDPELIRDAVRANGGPPVVRLALTMADQLIPGVAGWTRPGKGIHAQALEEWVSRCAWDANTDVDYVGTSPTTVIDWKKDA